MRETQETDVSGIVFEMEDGLRTAIDFAGTLNDRLTQRRPISEAEAARLGSLSGEVAHSLSETLTKWEKLYNAEENKPTVSAQRF
jgi:hypothetical protein